MKFIKSVRVDSLSQKCANTSKTKEVELVVKDKDGTFRGTFSSIKPENLIDLKAGDEFDIHITDEETLASTRKTIRDLNAKSSELITLVEICLDSMSSKNKKKEEIIKEINKYKKGGERYE